MRRLVNQRPNRAQALVLSMLPFALLICLYLAASHARLATNPGDKLLPSPATMLGAIHRYAVEEDERSGDILLWTDTLASLEAAAGGALVSAPCSACFGIAVGVIPYLRATFAPFVAALSLIPPLAILPILFIVAGLGELAKILLIIIGVAPVIVRDIALRTAELPAEQLIKAQTLGASTWLVIVRVVLPQCGRADRCAAADIWGPPGCFSSPRRRSRRPKDWGYRIFLVRRYLPMDVILPYVAWITLLAFAMDRLLQPCRTRLFAWAEPGR